MLLSLALRISLVLDLTDYFVECSSGLCYLSDVNAEVIYKENEDCINMYCTEYQLKPADRIFQMKLICQKKYNNHVYNFQDVKFNVTDDKDNNVDGIVSLFSNC